MIIYTTFFNNTIQLLARAESNNGETIGDMVFLVKNGDDAFGKTFKQLKEIAQTSGEFEYTGVKEPG